MKERLVGAAVLMAAAVILIPEMLSGPRRAPARAPAAAAAAQQGEAGRKRYTIDLQGTQPPSAVPETSNVVEAPAPPPKDVPAATEPAIAEPVAGSTSDSAASDKSGEDARSSDGVESTEQAPQPMTSAPTEASSAAVSPALDAAASHVVNETAPAASTATNSRRWAVQIMATASREDAQREAEDLRNGNYAAFVMPVQSGRSTLYRVRVGPFTQRTQAEEALRKLRAVRTNPIIVAQP